jgi:alkylated DNA repair dioxygenase AlkB
MAGTGSLQPTLFGSAAAPQLIGLPRFERLQLDDTAWIDLSPGFLLGADTLLDELVATLPLRQSTRPMYDKVVDEPRLSCSLRLYGDGAPPVVPAAARVLSGQYRRHFDACFVNHYRDGRDSVAWHRDRVGQVQEEPIIGILSLGGPRAFALRPLGGGSSVRITLHSGDLLVMGGSCQHTWEHAIPKVPFAAPRMSVTLRHGPPGPEPRRWLTDTATPPSWGRPPPRGRGAGRAPARSTHEQATHEPSLPFSTPPFSTPALPMPSDDR